MIQTGASASVDTTEVSYPLSPEEARFTPQPWHDTNDSIQQRTSVHRQSQDRAKNYIHKLRKKYKRHKMEGRAKAQKLLEQAQEIEHLRAVVE